MNTSDANHLNEENTGIVLDSRTVIEKASVKATGMLSFIEGEILEVELSEWEKFDLGNPVKVTNYSLGNQFEFKTSIIAKNDGVITLLNPPENQKNFLKRREVLRIDTNQSGTIQMVWEESKANPSNIKFPVSIMINNLSLSGIGFALKKEHVFQKGSKVQVEIDLGSSIPCMIEIVWHAAKENITYYGARFIEIPPQKINAIRAFILKSQIASRLQTRKAPANKRVFK